MAERLTKTIKIEEVPRGDGTTSREDFGREHFAHAPSNDPATWRLRLYRYPEDVQPWTDAVDHAVKVLKRFDLSPLQSRLDRHEVPYAKGRVAEAWRTLYGDRELPDVLRDRIEPSESE